MSCFSFIPLWRVHYTSIINLNQYNRYGVRRLFLVSVMWKFSRSLKMIYYEIDSRLRTRPIKNVITHTSTRYSDRAECMVFKLLYHNFRTQSIFALKDYFTRMSRNDSLGLVLPRITDIILSRAILACRLIPMRSNRATVLVWMNSFETNFRVKLLHE